MRDDDKCMMCGFVRRLHVNPNWGCGAYFEGDVDPSVLCKCGHIRRAHLGGKGRCFGNADFLDTCKRFVEKTKTPTEIGEL